MKAFNVTIRTMTGPFPFTAIGTSSAAVAAAALELFDGLCGVSVHPVRSS